MERGLRLTVPARVRRFTRDLLARKGLRFVLIGRSFEQDQASGKLIGVSVCAER